MTGPKVSILMLAYQSVRWIKQAIDSVKNQTYKNWELIIVDDGSTDGTWELAKACAGRNKKIKVVQNQKRLGIPKNRAKAYSLSTGDLICHLDNDDWIEPWAIEVMVDAFMKSPDVALMYSDRCQVGENGEHHHYYVEPEPKDENITKLGWRHFGMYQRNAMMKTNGYNTELTSACEDGDLFMQMAEKFTIAHVRKVLYYHRAHSNNTSSTNSSCKDCNVRPKCNYVRVWSKHAGYDHLTFTPKQ